ncbi:DAK2 domain-containing protein [Nicoliella spurrieriana]|uniref:DAK2 domain-containing protein n=1 Tax=Nicoliella spurrieriana TaxID=2925830 RepID=A0A976RRW5_9LACO|nr:DAK2 domain-containing protein [Nicoliella spurrieriana]UQS86636.1 DAK2 domain-containing protein [Nicoliella spurrieriana]
MSVTEIDSNQFRKMIKAASATLKNNADFVNSLNVFPVPDGDTGTNMNLSLASGAKYVANSGADSVGDLAEALAKGLLMGARGNSGVILSQIFRGFAKSVAGKRVLDARDLNDGLVEATKTAYSSVMKPTEGTILTVIRGAAEKSRQVYSELDVAALMDAVSVAADDALKQTTELLPVLKQVGVVDSGGQGLAFILKAFADSLNGREVSIEKNEPDSQEMDEMIDAKHHKSVQSEINPEDIKYGYCTQIMVRIGHGKEVERKFEYQPFYDYLAKLGDSLLVVNDDEIVKVHVHTEHPGKVLAWGQQVGDLATVKVDNMRLQQEDIINQDTDDQPAEQEIERPNDTAVIAVASGDGIGTLFNSLGVTDIISGGQTMNPSTQDIVDAINNSHANRAVILPNNSNIFLAAEQAAKVADIPTTIVHTKTIPQGMTAMLEYDPSAKLADIKSAMEANLDYVKSGEVTRAVRDTELDQVHIKKNQFMGIVDGNITVTSSNMIDATTQMVAAMLDEDSEAVTIIYGQGANERESQKLKDNIMKIDEDLEIEIHEGNQPVYPFLVSVE